MVDGARRAGVVELAGLTRRFGDTTAVDGVDLRVGAGELCCLVGPPGSGVTTVLRLIAGLDEPTCGRVLVDGEDLVGLAPSRRPVHALFGGYTLFPFLDVAANVAFGLRHSRGSQAHGRADTQARVRAALALVQMSEYARRRPPQLSSAQQQRVVLARALLLRPRVLLLDDPLGALDARSRPALRAELRALQRQTGVTFLLGTHDPAEALAVADQVAVLRTGRVVQVGTPAQVYAEPADAAVAALFGPTNLLGAHALG